MEQELDNRIISVIGVTTKDEIFYYNNEKEPYTGIALQYNPFTKIKECQGEFKDGKLNGRYEAYYENGNISKIQEFKDGFEVGNKQFYTEDGKLAYITEANNIQLDGAFNIMEIDYSYIENKIKIDNQKDFFTGTIVRYNENGTIGYICQFENGLKTGKEIWYTSDGIEKEVMNFKNNKLNGEKIDYYESGEVSRIESYKDDILVRSRKYEKNRELIVEDNNSIDEIINFIEYASFKEIQSVLGIYELEFVKEIEGEQPPLNQRF